jgi:ADP-ribose pyrophosphatase
MTETTLTTETIYKGKILALGKDTVELPNKNHAAREVVFHSGGVCVLPLSDNGEIIMVRQFRYPFKDVLLEIPAGKLEPGENPLECGVRELFEETGCTAESFTFIGRLYPTPAYCTEVIHMYLARGLSLDEEKGNSPDADEFLDVVKLPFTKAVDMVLNNEIPDAKTQLAVLKTKLLLENQPNPL